MILGIDNRLSTNFNHLMYADDLIIFSNATRTIARNINLCLGIYYRLTHQRPNNCKSAIYFLIPDSISNGLSTIARKFFWSKGGNRSSIQLVSWNNATLDKVDGGLAIRNLRTWKIASFAKNGFKYLNRHNCFWVDILYHKYGFIYPWDFFILPKCSLFLEA